MSGPQGGRPSKWSRTLQAKIVADVAAGVRPDVAAGVHGIVRSTYFDWMQKGEDGEPPYDGFRTAVIRARDTFEAKATKRILRGDKGMGFGPAKAALEVLSRRMPRQWAQQVKHHVETVEDEFFSALQQVTADPDVLARVRETQDLRVVLAAVCEVLASREGADDPSGDSRRSGDEAFH